LRREPISVAAKVLGPSSLTRRDDRIEGGNEVALAQRLLEQPQDAANARLIETVPSDTPQPSHILDVLRSSAKNLSADQVLDVDQRDDYQRPHRPRTPASAVRSSTAAG